MPRELQQGSAMSQLSASASIILSAGTYLFDFVSNMVVVYEYGRQYHRYLRLEHEGSCNPACRIQTSELAGYFWGMVGVLIFSHSLNAIIFKLKFRAEDGPFRAAYFLPLIHFWRLVNLLWRTLSFKGVQNLRSREMTGLYNLLGSSFEGVPFLILQFCAYLVLVRAGFSIHNMSLLFRVSVAASLLSAAYNGGTSVQSVAENAKTFKQKVKVAFAAGLFTMFATINRCLTYTNIIVRIREHFLRERSQRLRSKFHTYDTIAAVFLTLTIVSYWLFYWLIQFPKAFSRSLHDPKRCLASFTFGYMSILLGPLYPMVSEAKDAGELGSLVFDAKLILVAVLNLLTDLIVLFLTYMLGVLPVPYLAASLVSALGYLVSIAWYITIDTAISGSSVVRDLDGINFYSNGSAAITPQLATAAQSLAQEMPLQGGKTLPADRSVDIEDAGFKRSLQLESDRSKEGEGDCPRAHKSPSQSDTNIELEFLNREHHHHQSNEDSAEVTECFEVHDAEGLKQRYSLVQESIHGELLNPDSEPSTL